MILGNISYLDCIVFLLLLAPQLLIHVPPLQLLLCFVKVVPFLLLQLPYGFIKERFFTSRRYRSPFSRNATAFQDIVIRCVRFAFARIPASIGNVFFSKNVAIPFLRFRMLRHGILHSPIPWREIDLGVVHGVYIAPELEEKPDLVIYHCHGGGFSMGSTYFYLEFLLAWVSLLKSAGGYRNPAIFSLEYELVPNAAYPTQLEQVVAGYDFASSILNDSNRLIISGDSAGATLMLSLLLYLDKRAEKMKHHINGSTLTNGTDIRGPPGFALLISPWTTLNSPQNRDTPSDYLNAESLHLYGRQYAGSDANLTDPIVSPGSCKDGQWWARAAPLEGFGMVYGAEETLAPELKQLIVLLRENQVPVRVREEPGGIHAWPVVSLFLAESQYERTKGLNDLVKMIKATVPLEKS